MDNQDLKGNTYLSRGYLRLYEIEPIPMQELQIVEHRNIVSVKVNRLSRSRENLGKGYLEIKNSLVGLSKEGNSFSYLIKGDEQGISIYFITQESDSSRLISQFSSAFMDFDTEQMLVEETLGEYCYSGLVVGLPRILDEESSLVLYPICQAMMGKSFSILISSTAKSSWETQRIIQNIRSELTNVNERVSSSISAGDRSIQVENTSSKKYKENLEFYDDLMSQSVVSGRWETQIMLSATNEEDYILLTQLFKSSFSDVGETTEGMMVFTLENPFYNKGLVECFWRDQYASYHPFNASNSPTLYQHSSHTFLTSEQLATLIQFPEKEIPGFAIDESVLFESANRRGELSQPYRIGQVKNKGGQISQQYRLELDDLTRHILLVGMTGSGKTNTSKSLLTTLWNEHGVPFLVIESAKREYWELINLLEIQGEKFNLFTLGEESFERGVPYRLNPFEVVGNVSIQSHIDRLFATFKASFDLVPPTPFILEQALYAVYEDYGWDIITNENIHGSGLFPTLSDLVHKIDEIVEQSGYSGEIESNIKASLRARVNSLRIGGKGMMLDVHKSFPIDEILNQPTVFELEDLGDDETKSFVIGLLLTQLYEYRQTYQAGFGSSSLHHLLVIEEAHRLLKKEEEANSSKARAIEFFTNLLAEIRSFGQGIFIADQIPTKLASDTLKNTNLKIIHRTVAKEDRDTVGDAMNMTDEQKAYLTYLKRGVAAVYSEGDFQPKLVQFPYAAGHFKYDRQYALSETYNRMKDLYHKMPLLPEEYKAVLDDFKFDKAGIQDLFIQFSLEEIRQGYFIDLLKIAEEDYELQYRCMAYLLEKYRLPLLEQKDILTRFRREYGHGRF